MKERERDIKKERGREKERERQIDRQTERERTKAEKGKHIYEQEIRTREEGTGRERKGTKESG